METLAEYFDRPDTPAANSPVGNLIPRVIEKYPELNFEQARAMARDLLDKAAKGRIYRTPRVLSVAEQAANTERLKAAFGKVPAAAYDPLKPLESPVSSVASTTPRPR